jgi:DNA-directed RNA polymerase subunit RPC12/RpoP
MDITFACKKCGQHIAIDEAGAGTSVNCPKCGIDLVVPQAGSVFDGAAGNLSKEGPVKQFDLNIERILENWETSHPTFPGFASQFEVSDLY